MGDDARMEEIETKLAYQEKALKELNEVVYAQQRQIDRLTALTEELRRSGKEESHGPANEKPPHY